MYFIFLVSLNPDLPLHFVQNGRNKRKQIIDILFIEYSLSFTYFKCETFIVDVKKICAIHVYGDEPNGCEWYTIFSSDSLRLVLLLFGMAQKWRIHSIWSIVAPTDSPTVHPLITNNVFIFPCVAQCLHKKRWGKTTYNSIEGGQQDDLWTEGEHVNVSKLMGYITMRSCIASMNTRSKLHRITGRETYQQCGAMHSAHDPYICGTGCAI